LPLSFQSGGKTYYSLNKTDLEKFFKALNCDYTDQNLVELFGSIAEVYAPIHAIATRVANAKYELRKVSDDSPVKDNTYVNRILQQPNPLQNWQEFIYESVVWQYVNGKNFIYANVADTLAFNYKNVSAMWNLWAYMVEVLHEPRIKFFTATKIDDIIKGYRLADGTPDIPPQKILFNQFMSLDRNDNKINGKSPLLSAQKALANLMAVYEARGAIYLNRGALGLLVSELKDQGGTIALTPDEKKEVIADYLNDHGIVGDNKTPIGITGIPMKWIQIAMSISELLPFDETYADAAAIYGALNVPQDLMPTPKGATFENQKIAERALYQNVAIPLAKSRAEALTNFLKLREAGYYLHACHDHIEVLQVNRKEKAETSKVENETMLIQFTTGIITLNDWIAATGRQPVKGNALFDKRTAEMTEQELAIILPLLKIRATNNSNNDQKK